MIRYISVDVHISLCSSDTDKFCFFSSLQYDNYISQDNRGKKSRLSMPLSKLQAIVEEANRIPLNIGNPATKMMRIFSQAEEWMEKYYPLLKMCGIECSYVPSSTDDDDTEMASTIKIDQLHEAVSEADSELSIDLEEVVRLKAVVQKTQTWIDKSSVFTSKNNPAMLTGKKKQADVQQSMEEMTTLIEEASALEVDVSDELNLLKIEQSTVVAWRLQIQRAIKEIISSFGVYSQERISLYSGNVETNVAHGTLLPDAAKPDQSGVLSATMRQNVTRQQSRSRSNSFAIDDTICSGSATPLSSEVLEQNAFPLVTQLLRSSKSMKILTPESLLSDELGGAMSWLSKSFKFLSSHSEAYDRKNSSALDKLIRSGQTLLKFKGSIKEIPEDPSLVDKLRECWASVVNDDLDKLVDLKDKRIKFFDWCEKADEIISDADTRIQIDILKRLDQESASFPSSE